MSQQTIFYIVRHGETFWNAEHRIQGHTDNPLSEKGEQQAKELSELLRHVHFDFAYSSDLIRAKKTAEVIVSSLPVPLMTATELRERRMGTFEGKQIHIDVSYEEFRSWFELHDNPKRTKLGIESDQEVTKRVFAFLEKIHEEHTGKTILIASHASLIKAILVALGFATHQELGSNTVKNTAFVKLGFDGVNFSILETQGITKQT